MDYGLNGAKRIEIQGSNFVLREFVLEDSEALFELIAANREHLSQFEDDTSTKYPDLESVQLSMTHPKNPDRKRFGVYNLDGRLVGSVNFSPLDETSAEIGYWIGHDFGGNGYATSAAETIIDYLLRGRGFNSVFAFVHQGNKISQRVLEKCGLVISGHDPHDDRFLSYSKRAI